MASFSSRRRKTFRASTRVIRGARGIRIGFVTPGIKRAKRSASGAKRLNGVSDIVKDY